MDFPKSPSVRETLPLRVKNMNYSADNIRILTTQEVDEKFEWARIGKLATQYHRDPEWIEKGFQACVAAGVSTDYFVQRYLEKDRSVPFHEGVEEAFRELFVRKFKKHC